MCELEDPMRLWALDTKANEPSPTTFDGLKPKLASHIAGYFQSIPKLQCCECPRLYVFLQVPPVAVGFGRMALLYLLRKTH